MARVETPRKILAARRPLFVIIPLMHCPTCTAALTPVNENSRGMHWVCPQQHGRALNVPVVRAEVGGGWIKEFWPRVMATESGGRICPQCRRGLRALTAAEGLLHLDACPTCQLIWFDEDELSQLPTAPVAARPKLTKVVAPGSTTTTDQEMWWDGGWALVKAVGEFLTMDARCF
jgi:Zn-finger nucleic acid-binding protein